MSASGTTEITVCPQGPLLVRGQIELRDAEGRPIEPGRGTVALCRCGASARKPFCDGSHKLTGFERPRGEAP
jgi:CDGSH-type Zn-finger protein